MCGDAMVGVDDNLVEEQADDRSVMEGGQVDLVNDQRGDDVDMTEENDRLLAVGFVDNGNRMVFEGIR